MPADIGMFPHLARKGNRRVPGDGFGGMFGGLPREGDFPLARPRTATLSTPHHEQDSPRVAPLINVTAQVNQMAEAIHAAREGRQRLLVAIAGAPGSGKSTLAAEIGRRLHLQKVRVEIMPMDGFHLDNSVLETRGLKLRKGAPETFDSLGFVNAVHRLREAEEVVLPVFDRTRDLAIAGALVVPPDCQVVIVEGNYLLFDEKPWSQLAKLWDISARIDVPVADLRSRLIQRWLSHGFSRTAATQRAERNDLPNALRVMENSLDADFIL